MKEALKMALEALNSGVDAQVGRVVWTEYDSCLIVEAITAIKEPLVQPEQEPVKLRRGDILRCVETDELCTVWATSTTGKTLIKWKANDFGNYTAEQIGELFWIEEKNT